MTCVAISQPCDVIKLQGSLEGMGFQLVDNAGQPVDLTGNAYWFVMVDIQTGLVVLSDGDVIKDDVANGLLHWQPKAPETDTPGTYACYIQDQAQPAPNWPYDGRWFRLTIREW